MIVICVLVDSLLADEMRYVISLSACSGPGLVSDDHQLVSDPFSHSLIEFIIPQAFETSCVCFLEQLRMFYGSADQEL